MHPRKSHVPNVCHVSHVKLRFAYFRCISALFRGVGSRILRLYIEPDRTARSLFVGVVILIRPSGRHSNFHGHRRSELIAELQWFPWLQATQVDENAARLELE